VSLELLSFFLSLSFFNLIDRKGMFYLFYDEFVNDVIVYFYIFYDLPSLY
jgi:hypothetical protein